MDLFRGDAVHLRLGLGQQLEHCQRMFGHGPRDPARPDQLADLAQAAVLAMVLRPTRFPVVVMMAVIAMVVVMMVIMPVAVVMVVSMAVVVIAVVMVPVAVIAVLVMVPVAVVVIAVVVMVPVALVVIAVVMMMTVAMAVILIAVMVMMVVAVHVLVLMHLRVVHQAAAGRIEHVELGPGDPAAGHLARSELDPLHPEGSHVAPDLVEARPQIEEGAHEHVAAHPGRRVEVQDARHVELPLWPRTASLLIMAA
jgi:hypothetical protein